MTDVPPGPDNERLLARTHRLRSALAGIAGLAEYLRRSPELAEAPLREALERIHRSALHSIEEIDQLLVEVTHRASDAAASLQVVDLEALTNEVVDSLVIGNRRVDVRVGSVEVAVDPELFSHIVENLVVNARDHAVSDTPIVITAHEHPDRIELVIEDEGPGIPAGARPHLFDWGRPGGGPSDGHGVGLYLVARFAQRHGGRVWVTDRPGGGTAFHVELPTHQRLGG